MMPAVRERSFPFDAQVRLNPEDAAALALQTLKLQLTSDISGSTFMNPSTASTIRLFHGAMVISPVLPETAPSSSTGRAFFSPV